MGMTALTAYGAGRAGALVEAVKSQWRKGVGDREFQLRKP